MSRIGDWDGRVGRDGLHLGVARKRAKLWGDVGVVWVLNGTSWVHGHGLGPLAKDQYSRRRDGLLERSSEVSLETCLIVAVFRAYEVGSFSGFWSFGIRANDCFYVKQTKISSVIYCLKKIHRRKILETGSDSFNKGSMDIS